MHVIRRETRTWARRIYFRNPCEFRVGLCMWAYGISDLQDLRVHADFVDWLKKPACLHEIKQAQSLDAQEGLLRGLQAGALLFELADGLGVIEVLDAGECLAHLQD